MTLHEMGDRELYRMLRKSGRQASAAFSVLYDRHAPRLYAYCGSILKDPELARDVFQESLVKLYELARRGDEVQHVAALLLRIARNRCLNEIQKKSRRTILPFSELDETLAQQHESDQVEKLELIHAALDTLPEDCREAFLLKEQVDLSYKEISKVTGVSLTAVRSRIFRARRALREILTPYLNDLMS